jgi:lysophospholipase L1-like esterase
MISSSIRESKMKEILCFGDSNTWGYQAGSIDLETLMAKRLSFEQRWPGILQKGLGESCRIIEAGLNGRTTNIDDPEWVERNGLAALPMLLETHSPLSLIIIMLGTNDMKSRFNRSAKDIAAGMSEIIDKIRSLKFIVGETEPKILIVSPAVVYKEDGFGEDFKNASKKSAEYAALLKELSRSKNCFHVETSEIKYSEIDGVHLEASAHAQLGKKLIVAVTKEIFPELANSRSMSFSHNF